MAKFCLKKKSKRQPAKLRYKIEKKVREHNRKVRKANKKNPKKNKSQLVQVPNICPFKEDILKEAEAYKQHKEEEKKKNREAAKLERDKLKAENKEVETKKGLGGLVENAETRGKIHDALSMETNDDSPVDKSQENSLKAYYKEFKKVVEAADVVLEILDARDPLGTRCKQVEQAVCDGNKRLVLVLNKSDLVPREILDKWLKYLRKSFPAVPFKASTQSQTKRLGRRRIKQAKNQQSQLQGNICIGAELLMSLLGNYCRNKGIKTSIRVGVVGLPNVGKSSIINSLKRSRACNVGSTPGVTKSMQEVQLDSKIKLLDSPGIVFASGNDSASALKNTVSVGALKDVFTPANAILQRADKRQLNEMYDVPEFKTPMEFYALKAARMGRFKRGGIPDTEAAARSILEDWNHGKLKYYTVPPEEDLDVHIDAKIVAQMGQEFDLASIEVMESETMTELSQAHDKLESKAQEAVITDIVEKMETGDALTTKLISESMHIDAKIPVKKLTKKEKNLQEDAKKKSDPVMLLEGNMKLNKIKKTQFKKAKKNREKSEKLSTALTNDFDNVNIVSPTKDYDFEEHFPQP